MLYLSQWVMFKTIIWSQSQLFSLRIFLSADGLIILTSRRKMSRFDPSVYCSLQSSFFYFYFFADNLYLNRSILIQHAIGINNQECNHEFDHNHSVIINTNSPTAADEHTHCRPVMWLQSDKEMPDPLVRKSFRLVLFMLWLRPSYNLSDLWLPPTYKPEGGEAARSAHTSAASGEGTDLPVAPTVSLGTW